MYTNYAPDVTSARVHAFIQCMRWTGLATTDALKLYRKDLEQDRRREQARLRLRQNGIARERTCGPFDVSAGKSEAGATQGSMPIDNSQLASCLIRAVLILVKCAWVWHAHYVLDW